MKILFQPKQAALNYKMDNSPASWLGFGGSRGGAKSGAIRRTAVRRRMSNPNTACQILRRVWEDVNTNHIMKMWEEFPELHDYYKTSEHVIMMPEQLGGGRIHFAAAETLGDVERKAFGPEYMDILIDQAEQFTEGELNQIKTTCRWPGMPLNKCKMVLGFNPGGQSAGFLQRIFSTHEYHELEIPQDYDFIQAYGWDNVEWARAALAADGYPGDCEGRKCGKCGSCVFYSWDDKKRFTYYITRTQYGQEQNRLPAHLRAGQLMGDFKKFAGQYFSNWNEAVHVWNLEDIIFQEHWPVWISIDWGYAHSTAVYWHTQAGYKTDEGKIKRLVITFREYTTDHMSERALAEQIVAINDGLRISNVWGGHDLWEEDTRGKTKEQQISAVFRAAGIPSIKKAAVSRVDGWRYMHTALDEGEWIVTRNCKEVLKAIPTLVFDSKNPDARKNEDILKTKTIADDVADSIRYGLFSQASPEEVSDDVRMRVQASHLTDITNRNIHLMKLNADRESRVRSRCHTNGHGYGKYNRYGAARVA